MGEDAGGEDVSRGGKWSLGKERYRREYRGVGRGHMCECRIVVGESLGGGRVDTNIAE